MTTLAVKIISAVTGIGRATAIAFAKEGATSVVSSRKEAEGKALEAELRGLGAAEFVATDVRHQIETSNLVDRAVARFGRLDIAVSNAAAEGKPGPVTDVSAETYAASRRMSPAPWLEETRVAGHADAGQHRQHLLDDGGRGASNFSLHGPTTPSISLARPCGRMGQDGRLIVRTRRLSER
ncbi:NAD(P)-dependent dehydrogenase (short-subunit alcohol dehydrogenase family) [Nitrobacteraceae bacterium AZCC 2161]